MVRHDFQYLKGQPTPETRGGVEDSLERHPDARMIIPPAYTDDDVPDEWIRILEGQA